MRSVWPFGTPATPSRTAGPRGAVLAAAKGTQRSFGLWAALVLALVSVALSGQMLVVPLDDQQGHAALGLALRRLANTGIFMNAVAHPDDENNGLLVMLNRGQGYRTTVVTATRGNGGQNEIGPELYEALGVLRTEELAALHRFDGAEQYFTRAVDFGYSFSLDETLERWGRDEIVSDFVRLIRTVRPDVVAGMRPDGTGGGQHHQASAILLREAFRLAGDPTKYPDQLNGGLRAWQPRKLYFTGRFGFPGEPAPEAGAKLVPINLAVYDPLLGKTYAEIGTEARSMHKCQGMAQLLALPGPASTSFLLAESSIPDQIARDERSLFDGVDSTIPGLAKFAGAKPPRELTQGLSAIAAAVQTAQKRFDGESDGSAMQPLLAGLRAVRVLRGQLRGLTLDEGARFEIDFRLRQKEREFQQAVLVANSIRIDALANDGVVVPGQPVKVAIIVANYGADVTVKQVKLDGFTGDANCPLGSGGEQTGAAGVSIIRRNAVARCEPTLTVPANARVSEPYWHRAGEAGRYTFDADAPFGLPYRPTPFYLQVTFSFAVPGGNEEVFGGLPVEYRYEGNIFGGEKRNELLVVPAFSVSVTPDIAIVPADAIRPAPAAVPARSTGAAQTRPAARPAGKTVPAGTAPPAFSREVRVTVINDAPAAADGVVTLGLPQGWSATPAEQPVKFTRPDEARTLRFAVSPGTNTAPGEFHVRALVTSGGQTFSRGFQVIEYPHIHRQHVYDEADATLKVINVKTAPNLVVGYIMGVGDQVPPAIEQLGAKVEMITAEDLAWGNLSRFDAIVTGVRAYERRSDLRANNGRLLDYVFNGGTLLVQYNKFEFNDAQYGPYPAKVTANRVTDERAPAQVLVPDDPLFNVPNKITDAAWDGWAQERGLYFLGDADSRYRDLVQFEDPFPYNKGEKRGALVAAMYGKGRWVYIGLNLWRQLPSGTDGAYQLLANLISFGKPADSKPATVASPARSR